MSLWRQSNLRVAATWGITFLIIGGLIYFVSSDREKFSQLLLLSGKDLTWLFGAWLLLSIPRSLIQKVTANQLDVRLQFQDWYGLSMVTNLINMVVPARADYLFSATYLRRKYNMPLSRFGSMIYGNAVLLAVVLAVEGIVALLLLGMRENVWNWRVWVIVLGLGGAALPFVFLSSRFIKGNFWVAEKLRTALEGWELLRSDVTYLRKMVLLLVMSSLSFMVWMYTAYYALQFDIRLIPLLLVALTTQMSFFFSLTPGNLGIREAVVGFISSLTGLGFAEGVAITLLQRAVSTVAFAVMGSIFGIFIWREFTMQRETDLEGQS